MRSGQSQFGFLALAFLLGSASVRAQIPPETTQSSVPGKDSTSKAPPNESRPPAPTPAAGAVKENPKDGLKYVWIPPGTFMMGCSPGDSKCSRDEKPTHQVTISKGFWMGQTLVTVAAYKRFSAATGQPMPPAPSFNSGWGHESMPIVNVNWDEAKAYCQWAGGRVPTEAEWEYAARGGSSGARYGELDEIAWYYKNGGGNGTHDVAQKRANGFGLYDTLGNAREWVSDWYDPSYYQNSPASDPAGPASGTIRILRGGSWAPYPKDVRVSFRYHVYPVGMYAYGGVGLRCTGEANVPWKIATNSGP
jgi:formylglycine-generating enzyme required for sulfatase activity